MAVEPAARSGPAPSSRLNSRTVRRPRAPRSRMAGRCYAESAADRDLIHGADRDTETGGPARTRVDRDGLAAGRGDEKPAAVGRPRHRMRAEIAGQGDTAAMPAQRHAEV